MSSLRTDSLARAVGELLRQKQLTLAVAESCTGGLLGAHITDVPGSSDYFEGGVIAYSYEAKMRILGVPPRTLEQHGAVSPETVICMARGVRQLTQSDVGLAITGIAGPTGATPEKPVGLVCIALSSARGEDCQEYRWSGNRPQNRKWSVRAALEMLHKHLVSACSPTGEVPTTEEDGRPQCSTQVVDESSLQAATRCLAGGWKHVDPDGTPVEVEARFEQPDHPLPLAIKWQGQWSSVASISRTWSSGRGETLMHHCLVHTAGGAVFELVFHAARMRWCMVRGTAGQAVV